jgi:transposase
MADGGVWDGKTLSAFLMQEFDLTLQVRQCQRLFRQLGFRLRKPRPLIAHADPEAQAAYKKTPQTGGQSKRRPVGHR